MRKIRIFEHISLDGVISARRTGRRQRLRAWRMDGAVSNPGLGRGRRSRRRAGASICCLAAAPTISGPASGRRPGTVRWRTV